MQNRIKAAFVSAFKLDEAADLSSLAYQSSPEWDSVGHMSLVAALEKQFNCMLDMDDILDMSSYPKVVEIMQKYA